MSDLDEKELGKFQENRDGEVSVRTKSVSVDENLNAQKVIVENPEWNRYTDVEDLGEFEIKDTNFIIGSKIDVKGFSVLTIYYSKTVSDKDCSIIRVSALTSFEQTSGYIKHSEKLKLPSSNVYTICKEETKEFLSINVAGLNYVMIELAKKTSKGSNPIFNISISKN